MSTDTKPTNPKESFGEAKVAMGLVPDTAIIEENLAFLEGALKYGQYNWRIAGVKCSTYNRAMRRHMKKWWNGQDRDPLTRVRELASIRACCAILIDAEVCGMLNDDRPPRADVEAQLSKAAEIAAHLKELFRYHAPPQYTERDHGKGAAVPAGTDDARTVTCLLRPVPSETHEHRYDIGEGRGCLDCGFDPSDRQPRATALRGAHLTPSERADAGLAPLGIDREAFLRP